MRKFFAPLIAASLISAPVAAMPAERVGAPIEGSEGLAGNPWLPWVAGLIVVGVIIFLIVDDGKNDPVSV